MIEEDKNIPAYDPNPPWGAWQPMSAERIKYELSKIKPGMDIVGRGQTLRTQLADINYSIANSNTQNNLIAAGYTGPYVSQKNWGAYGSMGGIGEAKAGELYNQAKTYGEKTGDWGPMTNFMASAEGGNRKYHRSGFMGTGISISPLAAMGLFAGGIGALGTAAGAAAGVSTGTGIASLGPGAIGTLGKVIGAGDMLKSYSDKIADTNELQKRFAPQQNGNERVRALREMNTIQSMQGNQNVAQNNQNMAQGFTRANTNQNTNGGGQFTRADNVQRQGNQPLFTRADRKV